MCHLHCNHKAFTRKLFFLIQVVTYIIFLNGCGLFESDVNKETHKTQIVVHLTGSLAASEMATVEIDGEFAGVATANDVVAKEVPVGEHFILARDKDGDQAWYGIPKVKIDYPGTTYDVNLICEPARLTLDIGAYCSQVSSPPFSLSVKDNHGATKAIGGNIAVDAGKVGIVTFDHGNLSIDIIDAKNVLWHQIPLKYYQYRAESSYSLSCQ